MAWLICPICEQRFDSATSAAMPFCSDHCQQVDLGRWLNEDYGLPVERDELWRDDPVGDDADN